MPHNHSHHNHSHALSSPADLNKAFLWGIGLNIAYVAVEAVYGIIYGSMGLLSDAGHNLSDVAALALSFMGLRLAMRKANERYTYGYKKATVLISLLNAVILLVAVGFIVAESIEKIIRPQAVDGLGVAWIAGIGVLINGATMLFFRKDKKGDLNVRGAYLHMLADALVSVGVVVSGVIIHFTGWYVIDPVIGLVVAVIIVISAWGLLTESLRLSLDGVPRGIAVDNITELLQTHPGVADVHHLHIWAISTTETALTAHVVLRSLDSLESVKAALKTALASHGITHTTLEFEAPGTPCPDPTHT